MTVELFHARHVDDIRARFYTKAEPSKNAKELRRERVCALFCSRNLINTRAFYEFSLN